MVRRFRLAALAALLVAAVVARAQGGGLLVGPGKVGQVPEHPAHLVPVEMNALVLLGVPELVVYEAKPPVESWPLYGTDKHMREVQKDLRSKYEVGVRFETAVPCPAAKVYYGIYQPDERRVITPRYREESEEELDGESTRHEVVIDLARIMRRSVDAADLTDGGIVAYRIEVYDPRTARTVFYDRRFEFVMQNGQHVRVPTIVEGPFVDRVTTDSAVLSWALDRPATCVARVGGRVYHGGDRSPRTRFEIPVAGLLPDTVYSYEIDITDRAHDPVKGPWTLRTQPETATRFTFAIMGDSREGVGGGERALGGTNYKTLTRFFADAVERGAEFIVHSGDLINGYTTSNLDFFLQLAAFKHAEEVVGHSVPIYEVMGNHEAIVDAFDDRISAFGVQFDKAGESSAEAFFAREFVNPVNGPEAEPGGPTYRENVYTFDHGNCRFVVMNNNYWFSSHAEQYGGNLEGYVLDRQFEWLFTTFDEAAKDARIDHLFLIAQEAMFPNGGHVGDGMWYSGGDSKTDDLTPVDRTYVVERRDAIWRAFAATGKAVAAIFGDEHAYNRTRIHRFEYTVFGRTMTTEFPRPVWQIISGGAGAPFYAQDRSVPWVRDVEVYTTRENYTLFHVDGKTVTLEVWSVDGERVDQAVLTQ